MNVSPLPKKLWEECREVLLACPECHDHETLSSFCNPQAEIYLLANKIKTNSSNRRAFIEQIISDCYQVKHRELGYVFPLFLKALQDNCDRNEERWEQLNNLYSKIKKHYKPEQYEIYTSNEFEKNVEGQAASSKPLTFILEHQKLLDCANSVAHISVPKFIDGCPARDIQKSTGTAWLVTSELALTCFHVIKAANKWDESISHSDLEAQVNNTLLNFDNIESGRGRDYGLTKLEHYNSKLDYALLRIRDEESTLQNRGFLKLETNKHVPFTIQTELLVIQHPKGQPQQESRGYFKQRASDANFILHDAFTDYGTSGSPVFKLNNWQVVALHIGEEKKEELPQATLITAILSNLEQHKPDIYNEIIQAQKLKE